MKLTIKWMESLGMRFAIFSTKFFFWFFFFFVFNSHPELIWRLLRQFFNGASGCWAVTMVTAVAMATRSLPCRHFLPFGFSPLLFFSFLFSSQVYEAVVSLFLFSPPNEFNPNEIKHETIREQQQQPKDEIGSNCFWRSWWPLGQSQSTEAGHVLSVAQHFIGPNCGNLATGFQKRPPVSENRISLPRHPEPTSWNGRNEAIGWATLRSSF